MRRNLIIIAIWNCVPSLAVAIIVVTSHQPRHARHHRRHRSVRLRPDRRQRRAVHIGRKRLERDVVLVLGVRLIVDGVAGQPHRFACQHGKGVRLAQQPIGGLVVGDLAAGAGARLLEGELHELEQLPEMRLAVRPDGERLADVEALRVRADERMRHNRLEDDGLEGEERRMIMGFSSRPVARETKGVNPYGHFGVAGELIGQREAESKDAVRIETLTHEDHSVPH